MALYPRRLGYSSLYIRVDLYRYTRTTLPLPTNGRLPESRRCTQLELPPTQQRRTCQPVQRAGRCREEQRCVLCRLQQLGTRIQQRSYSGCFLQHQLRPTRSASTPFLVSRSTSTRLQLNSMRMSEETGDLNACTGSVTTSVASKSSVVVGPTRDDVYRSQRSIYLY
jgi:hypothetical protein